MSFPQLGIQRLPEPVQDIPQSITIVPRQIIEEQAATTLRDALRNVTGIGIAAGVEEIFCKLRSEFWTPSPATNYVRRVGNRARKHSSSEWNWWKI